ncbi:MAG: hypothetical protein MZV63_56360 [Marinilabiliales bacterium]|nr:hypothetical protein [Marinilabiliales bacterium]
MPSRSPTRKHDLIAVRVFDERETGTARCGADPGCATRRPENGSWMDTVRPRGPRGNTSNWYTGHDWIPG